MGDPTCTTIKLVSPANAAAEIQPLARAGANEIYCGAMPAEWSDQYGDWDSLTRRQGDVANISSLTELRELAHIAGSEGVFASLALNARYTAGQVGMVLDLIGEWEAAGGHGVIASSPAILSALAKSNSKLARHVSLLANVTNSFGVAFYRRWGVSRVILPRDLSLAEMESLTRRHEDIEFEAMALNEKCRFVDGLCGFYHGRQFPSDTPTAFRYEVPEDSVPVVFQSDLCYAGHGCRVPFIDEHGGQVRQPTRNDLEHPACAACDICGLSRSGVTYLKIGGRGLPLALKVRSVAFLRQACSMAISGAEPVDFRKLYKEHFGNPCVHACYYRGPSGRGKFQ